jgi:hypothetical protein
MRGTRGDQARRDERPQAKLCHQTHAVFVPKSDFQTEFQTFETSEQTGGSTIRSRFASPAISRQPGAA